MNIYEALTEILNGNPVSPSRIATVTTKTEVKLRKNDRFPNGVEKYAQRHGMIGTSYQNSVNNQRQREGQPVNWKDQVLPFTAQALWKGMGEHIPGNPYLVRHTVTKEEYLAFFPLSLFEESGEQVPIEKDRFRDKTTGTFIGLESFAEYMSDKVKPDNQETDKQIFWRTFRLCNVVSIKCGKLYNFV